MTESLRHQRARFAYERIREWPAPSARAAAARAKGLPIQLRTQGLGTTVAMLTNQASDRDGPEDDAALLVGLLADWLLRESPRQPFGERERGDTAKNAREWRLELLDACCRSDRATYMAAQAEALALLEEVKILTQALHGDD